MQLVDLLDKSIPHLGLNDTVQDAFEILQDLKLWHLPLVDKNGKYIFMLNEDFLFEKKSTQKFEELNFPFLPNALQPNQHYYDALRLASKYELEVIPVINNEGILQGSFKLENAILAFANTYSIQHDGGILVLSMLQRDYSLSEISRLVESNDAKILIAHVDASPQNSSEVYVTLKIDQTDLTRIIATFKRYKYDIVANYHHTIIQDTDKSRVDSLLKYLDI